MFTGRDGPPHADSAITPERRPAFGRWSPFIAHTLQWAGIVSLIILIWEATGPAPLPSSPVIRLVLVVGIAILAGIGSTIRAG